MRQFIRILLQTIKNAVFSHDSFMIFAIASLFYMVFYGLPYDNQIIVKVPTAIVNLDQSRTSAEFAEKIKSAPAVKAVIETADFPKAKEAFRRSEADVIVTIPENFSRDIERGDQTGITVFSNGALPVKGRAVSAAVLAIVTEENATHAAERLVAQGLNPILVKQMSLAPAPFSSQDLFNNISGYGYYTVPMVDIVIIQAVMLFGVGIALGGWLSSENPPEFFKEAFASPKRFLALFTGFWVIALFWSFFIEGLGLYALTMPTLLNPLSTVAAVIAFTLALCSLATLLTLAMNSNRYAAGLVLASAPSVFLSGLVFPMENFAAWVLPFAWMIPTTPGCQAIVLASQEGATIAQILPQISANLAQAIIYGTLAYLMLKKRIAERQAKAAR